MGDSLVSKEDHLNSGDDRARPDVALTLVVKKLKTG